MLTLIFAILSLSTFAYTGEITTPPTQFPGYTSQVADGGVASCFITRTNQIVYTWADNQSGNVGDPWYAIYDLATKTFSTPPTQIAAGIYTLKAYVGVYCCYNSKNNQVIFSWSDDDGDSYAPWYAVYDVSTKNFSTQPTKIANYLAQVNVRVYCCYNVQENKVIFSWIDALGNNNPWYACLDAYGNVSQPVKLANKLALADLYCCSTSSDEIVFSYNSNTFSAKGAILKLSTSAITNFDIPTNLSVANDVFCSYDNLKNQVAFSWAGGQETSFQPYFILYDLNSLSFVSASPRVFSSQNYTSNLSDVYSCYNSIDKQFIFAWGERNAGNVYYAIYDTQNNSFSTPMSFISASYTNSKYSGSVFPCYASLTNQVFFSWASEDINDSKTNPWYAIYTSPLPASYTLKAIKKFSPLKFQR